MIFVLELTSGICWTLVYLGLIRRGFEDKICGMPLFALAFNISWEFIFTFLIIPTGVSPVELVSSGVWFLLDAIILYTYFKYGRKEFPKTVGERWFVPWTVVVLLVGFTTIYAAGSEFDSFWGATYSAFAQNLMMSALFIGMLVRRNSIEGQSMYIAIFKWIGTIAPTIEVYVRFGNELTLALGMSIFIFDVIYIVLLYQKYRELGLDPWTRKAKS